MIIEKKIFALADLPEAEEEKIERHIKSAWGRVAYHVDRDTDVLIYAPGQGEHTREYKVARESADKGGKIVLMTPALFWMLTGLQTFDQVPRKEKMVAAVGYMTGGVIWQEQAAAIERFLKYEHESILDRAYMDGNVEYIYIMFQYLTQVEDQWIDSGYADDAYLPDLLNRYAQRAIDDDKQDLTSYILDLKERHTQTEIADGMGQFDLDSFTLDDFQLDDCMETSGDKISLDLPVYYSCGKHVSYGRYRSSGKGVRAPIDWVVIDREDDRALLMSTRVLDIQPFNDAYLNTSWENCSLRQWLEDEFYENAFAPAEKARILPTRLKNGKGDGVNGAVIEEVFHDTFDRVFLLSTDEVRLYLIGSSAIRAGATDYVKSLDVPSAINDHYRWWGRSMGINPSTACVVDYNWVNGYGENINSSGIGVRPVMWIDLA